MTDFNPLICGLCLLEIEESCKSQCSIKNNDHDHISIIVTELFGNRLNLDQWELICLVCQCQLNNFYRYFKFVLENREKIKTVEIKQEPNFEIHTGDQEPNIELVTTFKSEYDEEDMGSNQQSSAEESSSSSEPVKPRKRRKKIKLAERRQIVIEKYLEDVNKSARKIAKELNFPKTSVSTILRQYKKIPEVILQPDSKKDETSDKGVDSDRNNPLASDDEDDSSSSLLNQKPNEPDQRLYETDERSQSPEIPFEFHQPKGKGKRPVSKSDVRGEEKRKVIIDKYLENVNESFGNIAKALKVPKSTVISVIKRYKETKSIKRKKTEKGRTVLRYPHLESHIIERLSEKPDSTIRELAAVFGVSRGWVHSVLALNNIRIERKKKYKRNKPSKQDLEMEISPNHN